MDSPTPPQAPDPTVVANAQGAINNDAARLNTTLNRADQVTPYGSLNWTQGKNADGTSNDQWTSNLTLDPRVQQLVDSYLSTSQSLTGSVNSAADRVQSTLANPIDYSALPAAANMGTAYGQAVGAVGGGRDAAQTAINGQSTLAGQSQDLLGSQLSRLQDMYSSNMNFDSAPAMPVANDATRQRVEDALYNRATSRLDPQFASADALERSTLMNRGIVENSDPWRNELDTFNRGKNDAYSTAMWDSISKGGDAMQQLFNMELAARQQGVSETKDIRNNATAEGLAAGALNSGVTGDLSRLLSTQTQQNAQLTDATKAAFDMQGQTRATALSEEERQRAQVLNELASLRNGTQVTMPTFGATPSGATVTPAPYAQSAYNNYNGAIQQYQADVGSNNATMGGISSVLAAIFGGK